MAVGADNGSAIVGPQCPGLGFVRTHRASSSSGVMGSLWLSSSIIGYLPVCPDSFPSSQQQTLSLREVTRAEGLTLHRAVGTAMPSLHCLYHISGRKVQKQLSFASRIPNLLIPLLLQEPHAQGTLWKSPSLAWSLGRDCWLT